MFGILLEWLVMAAVLVGGAYALYRAWVRWTWAGKRLNQDVHKTSIEQGAEIRCPIHGKFPASQLIRAEGDHMVCPECYKLYVEIPTFTINDIPKHETSN
jgi:hypothetical protein